MTVATALWISIFGIAVFAFAQDDRQTPLACNLKAIPAAERPHYNDLMKRLRTAVRERRQIPHGYAFGLDGKVIGLGELGEWMSMERQCCPFFSFQLSVAAQDEQWLLALTGPSGVEALIEQEFPDPALKDGK